MSYLCGLLNSIVYWIFRWWKEAQRDDDNEIGGVLYSASLNDDIESEIVLDLRKKEDSRNAEKEEEGFSGREYALLPQPMWLWALKRWACKHLLLRPFDLFFFWNAFGQELGLMINSSHKLKLSLKKKKKIHRIFGNCLKIKLN